MQPSKGSISIKGMVAPILELGAGFDGEMTVKENIFLRGALLGYQKEFILEKYGDIIEFSELNPEPFDPMIPNSSPLFT